MGTGVNHLVRREAGYWFRRCIPQPVAASPKDSVAIYLDKPHDEAIRMADRIAAALARGNTTVCIVSKMMNRADAERHVKRLSPGTIDRDIDLLSAWAKWVMRLKERRLLLQDGLDPFAGIRSPKSDVRNARSKAGRDRRNYRKDEIALPLGNLPDGQPGAGNRADRARARRWAVLIALYSGMRLSEIAMLRLSHVKTKDGVRYFDVVAKVGRRKKMIQSVRPVPVHPALIDAGLLDLIAERRGLSEHYLLPLPEKAALVASVNYGHLAASRNSDAAS